MATAIVVLPSPDEGREILPKIRELFPILLTLCIGCFVRNYVSRVQKHSLPKCCKIIVQNFINYKISVTGLEFSYEILQPVLFGGLVNESTIRN